MAAIEFAGRAADCWVRAWHANDQLDQTMTMAHHVELYLQSSDPSASRRLSSLFL